MHEEYGDLDADYVIVNLWGGRVGRAMTYDSVQTVVARAAPGGVRVHRPHAAPHLRHPRRARGSSSAPIRGCASVDSVLDVDLDAVGAWAREAKANRSPAAFVRFAHGHLTRLRYAAGDLEVWQADVWPGERLPRTGSAHHLTRITFTGIASPWFRKLVKRWARTPILSLGVSPYTVQRNVHDTTAFAESCQARGVDLDGPRAITRALLERYLAQVNRQGYEPGGKKDRIVTLRTLLNDARVRGWADLRASATFHRGEADGRMHRLPRAIDEHVCASSKTRRTSPASPSRRCARRW